MPLNPHKTSPNQSKSSLVRRHLCVLMCRESYCSPIPPSLSKAEKEGLVARFPVGCQLFGKSSPTLIAITDLVKTGIHMNQDDDFEAVKMELMRWGLCCFSFDWESNLFDHVNTLALEVFWNSFNGAIESLAYKFKIDKDLLKRENILPVLLHQFKRDVVMYKGKCQNLEVLEYHYMVAKKKVKSGVDVNVTTIFHPRNYTVMGEFFKVTVTSGTCSVEELHFELP
ncbi:uncharacterized protein MELLADRAFT_105506 [Melampsora larici-populina 98AG31]|uniref:Uncharacterized protein n=1 Tax=Melampsora larici-populina (strain 98AG31 / pathotype 3-4-7) TaxID=747676 RepID=F4RIF7_MELLP|nr:uncharacterized protein MELLADRAFT_105506 [Melampsora larici-populina 98AG31]EGG07841.1 hypothetical protein MELLADRAFT_105506 [Melampsora larici-populina 98AG31]